MQNTLSGLQQVILALNTQENQYRTNIYATPKEIKAYNLRLDETAAQKGIKLSSLDGSSSQKALKTAMETFQIQASRPAHDALGDAYHTALICAMLDLKRGAEEYDAAG